MAAVPACARAVIQPTHPRRGPKGNSAGCPGWVGTAFPWRSGAAERMNRTRPPATVVESAIYIRRNDAPLTSSTLPLANSASGEAR
jgi:hypothetical protein